MRVASGCLCFSFIFLLLKKNKFSILIFGILVMINSSVCVLLCFLCFVVLYCVFTEWASFQCTRVLSKRCKCK